LVQYVIKLCTVAVAQDKSDDFSAELRDNTLS